MKDSAKHLFQETDTSIDFGELTSLGVMFVDGQSLKKVIKYLNKSNYYDRNKYFTDKVIDKELSISIEGPVYISINIKDKLFYYYVNKFSYDHHHSDPAITYDQFEYRYIGMDSILKNIDKLENKTMSILDKITKLTSYHLELRFILTPVAVRVTQLEHIQAKMVYVFGIRVYREGLY